jgi:hypothetical protein
MFRRTSVLIGIGLCFVASTAGAKKAPSTSDNIWQTRIASLRAQGPEGLAKALRAHDKLQQANMKLEEERNRLSVSGNKGETDSAAEIERKMAALNRQLDKLRVAIDQIGGQRSCAVSRLYWYTDLSAAQAEAAGTGRPILSLRMLGKLTDEFSCANSRFFRTALYSNKDISDYLRDHFVLHWQSVRPVPRVTIDFGDGRKLERTLTGNSAHYVLTSMGQPLDVLPGLYSPLEFYQWLKRLNEFHDRYLAATETERGQQLADFHKERGRKVFRDWVSDVEELGNQPAAVVASRINLAIETASRKQDNSPLAAAAAKLAMTKRASESPLLRFANYSGPWVEYGMDDQLWRDIALLHRHEVKLDERSVAVMRRQFLAAVAMRVATSKMAQEDPVLRMVRTFEDSMTLDTVRNEYLLHRRIHEAFAAGQAETANVDTLNEWVYAELFLTPSSDPWLGLAPPDVYTALDGDGRIEATAAVLNRPGG